MMRGFSSRPHRTLIGRGDDGCVQLANLPRVNLAILIAAVLAGGVILGGVAASLPMSESSPTPAATSSTPSATPSSSAAVADVAGQDFDRLPRYPESVRSGYDIVREDRFRLTAAEYQAQATVEDVRNFYQGVIAEHGWERADINFDHGEWSYVLVDGSIEALIEVEEFGGLVEIDLQISEPITAPTPAAPDPTPAPTAVPIAPPPPPPAPPSDDDDDGDDGGGGDSDDGGDDGSDDG